MAQTQPPDTQRARPDEPDPGGPQLRRSSVKVILLAVIVAILLVIVYFSPLRQYRDHLRELSQRIRSFGPLAPWVLTAGVAVLVALGFPRLFFCILAGMALGFWSGLFWAQLGTLVGNYLFFVGVRTLGREWGERVLSKRANLKTMVERRGVLGVVLARQLPLPGLLVNIGCALLPIRHVEYLYGTIIGQLPQAIPCTLIGAGLLQASLTKSIGVIGLAVALSIVGWLCLRYVLNRRARP